MKFVVDWNVKKDLKMRWCGRDVETLSQERFDEDKMTIDRRRWDDGDSA